MCKPDGRTRRTRSTRRSTCSSGVCGSTPCPRLKANGPAENAVTIASIDWCKALPPASNASCPEPDTASGSPTGQTHCLSSSSHFPLRPYSNALNPVVLPPGRARLATDPAPTGSMTFANTIGTLRVIRCNATTFALAEARMTSGPSPTNSSADRLRSASPPTSQRVSIRRLRPSVPAQFLQPVQECRETGLHFPIIRSTGHKHADAPFGLLGVCDEGPSRCHATDERDEFPSPHGRPLRPRAALYHKAGRGVVPMADVPID